MSFLTDNFTGTAATSLASHSPDTGSTWSKDATFSSGTGNLTLDGSGFIKDATTGTDIFYTNAASPASADYYVEAVLTNSAGNTWGGVLARWTAGTGGYFAFVDGGGFTAANFVRLYRYGGSGTAELGSYNTGGAISGSHTIRISCVGTMIKVLFDGVERISVTETSITATGKAGVRIGESGGNSHLLIDSVTADAWFSAVSTSDSGSGSETSVSTASNAISASDSGGASESSSVLASVLSVGAMAGDDFTDTASTLLTAHTPTGASASAGTAWHVGGAGLGNASPHITSAGRAATLTAGGITCAYLDAMMGAADYDVSADLAVLTRDGGYAGVLGRYSDGGGSSESGLLAAIDTSGGTAVLTLYRYGGSGSGSLATYSMGAVAGTFNVRLSMAGTAIKVYLDGTQRISVTETSITATGNPAVRIFDSGTVGDASNVQVDNFSATGTARTCSDSAVGTDTAAITGQVVQKPAPQTRTTSGARRDISTGKLTVHTWTGFNGAVRCPNGDLLVASPDGASETAGPYTTMFLRSTDNGATWTNEGNHGWEGDAAVFWFTVLENRTIVLTTIVPGNAGAGEPSWVTLLATSTDNGHSWSTRTRITTFGLSIGTDSSHISAGGLIELASGSWLCAWERVKASGDIDTYVSTSTDGGTTWTNPTVVGSHTGDAYDEPTLVQMKDGRIACFIRVEVAPNTAGTDKRIYVAYSSDNGATWTTPTECFRNASGHPAAISTPDGAILIAYRMQPTTTSGPTAVRQSLDYGATWSSEVQIGQNSYQSLYGQAVLTNPRGGGSSDVTFFFAEEPISGGGTVGAVYAQDYTGVASGVELGTGMEGVSNVQVTGNTAVSANDTAIGTESRSISTSTPLLSKSATDVAAGTESTTVQANVTFASLTASDAGAFSELALVGDPTAVRIVRNTVVSSTLFGVTGMTSAQFGQTSVVVDDAGYISITP